MDENGPGSSNSIRNLPNGKMHNIRQMFEGGETDNNPTSPMPSARQALAPQSSVQTQPQQPKPVPRGKPKLADLPAKPKVYCVPIHKSQLDGVSSSPGNIHQDLKKIYESPRKLSEPTFGSPVAQSFISTQKEDKFTRGKPVMKTASFNVPRKIMQTQEQNEKDTSLASELQVKLRKRQAGNAIKVHANRKSETDMTSPPVSEKPPLPLSPKRFSDSFENTTSKASDLRVQFDLQTIAGSPRQSQDASDANDNEAQIDVSAKAKLFESKKTPPERPALPKFKPGHIRQRSAGSAVEYSKINKTKDSTTNQESVNTESTDTPEPPKKPPRTHAHDDYLKVKLKQNKVQFDDSCQGKTESHKTESEQTTTVKSPVYETIDKDDSNEEEIYGVQVIPISVKDRISQLHQRPLSYQDDSTVRRHPPARPPPPRLRPHSEFIKSPAAQSATHASLFFPKTAPEIPDTSPPMEVYEPAPAFKKYGTLPRRPCKNRPSSSGENDNTDSSKAKSGSKKFPLRKSLSSECLYMGNGVCERFYHDPAEFVGPAETFEAYVDNEGYAVPNKFVKRKVREQISWDPESVQDKPLGDVLKAKFDDIKKKIGVVENKQPPSQFSDFNKRSRLQVREKINQAFSILRRYVGRNKDSTSSTDKEEELDTTSTDSDSFVDVEEIKKRKIYATTIRKKTYQSVKKSKEFVSSIYPQLFEYAVLVGLRPVPAAQGYEAYIIHKFPEIVDSNVSVPLFCFPDAAEYKPVKNMKSETYSFVLTNFDGGRVFGYCKRIQPCDSSLPEVICIISPVDAINMYNVLLNEIEMRRQVNMELSKELLAASFGRPLPKPGQDVQIRCLDEVGEMETVHLHRPSDDRLDNVNYDCLLVYLGTDRLIKVFSTLLLERRVILYSKSLSVITQVIHAVVALLYPFHWQHIYIPILPSSMLDVCCSPTPYLIGILTSHLNTVIDLPLEEVMIVDLDKKNILRSVGDESTILPKKITKALKTAINMCKIDAEAERSQTLMISEAFLRVFVEIIGHYGEFITTQQDGKKMFLKENFISKIESQGLQQFLEWFSETQMFEVFITNHLEKQDWGSVDIFMNRVMEYNKDSGGVVQERTGLGTKVKNIRKAIKSKIG